MPRHRKLGRTNDIRLSMLRGLVTTLLVNGSVKTTVTRAKEVEKIAEKLITIAIKEKDSYTTKEVLVSSPKLDSKGHKLLQTKKTAAGKSYDVVERELKTKMVQVDDPKRLAARRQLAKWLVKSKSSKNGEVVSPINHVFNEVAPKYSSANGGYTRFTRLGPRRGDAAEMVLLELV